MPSARPVRVLTQGAGSVNASGALKLANAINPTRPAGRLVADRDAADVDGDRRAKHRVGQQHRVGQRTWC